MTSIVMIFDNIYNVPCESNKFYQSRINNVRDAPRNNENGHLKRSRNWRVVHSPDDTQINAVEKTVRLYDNKIIDISEIS